MKSYGWNSNLEVLFRPYTISELDPGRVVRADRNALTIATAAGECRAVMAGRLDAGGLLGHPVAGDWVAVDQSEDTAVVRAILPRRGELTRRRPGGAERAQCVAANVDLVVIVESVDRGPNARRIERGVSLAYAGGATPLIVLAKADLSGDVRGDIERAAMAAPFSEVVAVSATTGEGLHELDIHLGTGVTAVLLGPSGAGKSTLANRLLGEELLAVGEVREGDNKGRHTTTRSALVRLPSGACLIDTPGVRELGLWLSVEDIDAAFADIDQRAAECRFRDCRHVDEPGCAVVRAVADGDLAASRLEGYHKLRREAEQLEVRRDASRSHEQRARDRSFARLCRAELKRKGLK